MRRDTERTVYREYTPWPGWAKALVWGSLGAAAYPILAGWDTDLPLQTRLLLVALILGFGAALHWFLGGLTVLVQETRIFLHFGRVPLVRKVIPYDEIRSLESVRYRPIAEFGGWGIRGWGKKKAWTARGDQAVVLHLEGDRRFYIGSDHPRRLEERIRTAMGRAAEG